MSNDTQEKLINCFKTVFPNLSGAEILNADTDSVAAWDSLAAVTLIFVIEEEFGASIEPEDFERLTSFAVIQQYLREKN